MPQPAQSVTAPNLDRRISERVGIQRSAVLRIEARTPIPVTLVNLTRDGCLIETDAILTADQRVELGIAGVGPVVARVVRSSSVGYGCEFLESLPSGAITRASRGNVVQLDNEMVDAVAAPTDWQEKMPSRHQIAVLAAVGIGSWAVVGVVAFALLG